jgi:hypothetical protein
LSSLDAPDVRLSVTGRLAVGQVDEEHTQALKSELGRGAAHCHLEVVGMCTECEDVARLIVGSHLTRGMQEFSIGDARKTSPESPHW